MYRDIEIIFQCYANDYFPKIWKDILEVYLNDGFPVVGMAICQKESWLFFK